MHAQVVVVGSGIAGTCAALSAAQNLEQGSVLLASRGPLFSGSSFFEGTWGLGLIGPDGAADEEDLVATILRVGCGAADEAMARSFVEGISPAIEQLRIWGVKLKEPDTSAADQREYIPCFDHKHRSWHGIERAPYIEAMSARIAEASIDVREGWELLDFNPATNQAVFYDVAGKQLVQVSYDALILCTGGMGTLFSRHLTRADCEATVQGLASSRGCTLTNMAFMQFMPGLIRPVQGAVFNEKTFRFMQLDTATVQALGGEQETARLLDMRSGYGPFTCRLDSCAIDLRIQAAGAAGLTLQPTLDDDLPEFVRVYQEWLHESAGITDDDPLTLAMYAHANNGGLSIDPQGATSIPGVFAAGECTGGMHGADRLGGLSSANGLVFGLRAGAVAAAYAHETRKNIAETPLPAWTQKASPEAEAINKALVSTMDENCGVMRTHAGIAHALEKIAQLMTHLEESSLPTEDASLAAATRRVYLRLLSAQAMARDIAAQSSSRGSHYWAD